MFDLIAAGLRRNPVRTGLVFTLIVVTILIFVFIHSALVNMRESPDASIQGRNITNGEMSPILMLPLRYAEEVRRIPHVKAAAAILYFGGKDRKHPDVSFSTFAIDEHLFEVYDDVGLSPADRSAWLAQRDGIVVGKILAERMGWKVGDSIRLVSGRFPERTPWEFKLVGIWGFNTGPFNQFTAFIHYDYVNDALPAERKDVLQFVASVSDDPALAASMPGTVDRHFFDSEFRTKTQDEKSFMQGQIGRVSAILDALGLIGGCLFCVMAVVLMNAVFLTTRERRREYATLGAIGFSRPRIIAVTLIESAVLAGGAGLFAVLLAPLVIGKWLGPFVQSLGGRYFPSFAVHPSTLGLALLISLVLGILTGGIVPLLQIGRMNIASTLRTAG